MQVTIDGAGRVVIPKTLRERLRLHADTRLDIELVDDHLELTPREPPAAIVQGPHGPVVAASGSRVSDEDVRDALESARERG